MTKFVISYRAPEGYEPGHEDDLSAWTAWFQGMGDSLVDFGNPVRDVKQIGNCSPVQRLRGYSVVSADNFDSALRLAKGCPGLRDSNFGVEVGAVLEREA
jgi:hypothetical protein